MITNEDLMRKQRRRRARNRAYLHSAVVVLLILAAGFVGGCLVGQAMQGDPSPSVITLQIIPPPEPEAVQEPEATQEKPAETERDLELTETVDLGKFKVTHYCPCELCCDEWADGITYTGTTATAGRTVAVDPDVIPLGSTVVIDGHEYIAEDIGGAIQGNRIDVFMDSHEAALIEGIKETTVSLVKEANV